MTTKQWLLVPLFEQFIKDSYNGKRIKADGKKIKPQTVDNYNYVLKNVKEYEAVTNTKVRIKAITSQNKRILASERSYWKKFYNQFTDYLTRKKGCYDNYIGSLIKVIRVFFNYLKMSGPYQ